MMAPSCPAPGRWVLDALAAEVALEAAEAELRAARSELVNVEDGVDEAPVVDRYLLALTERNTLRASRP